MHAPTRQTDTRALHTHIEHVDTSPPPSRYAEVPSSAGSACVVLLPPLVWKPLMYMFVTNSLSLATGGFVDNFYLDPVTFDESRV